MYEYEYTSNYTTRTYDSYVRTYQVPGMHVRTTPVQQVSIIPTAVLYLLVVSFQTFGNTKYRTQPLQHSYEPTPTAPSKVSSEWSVICYAHLVLHWVGPPATCVLVRGREPLLALDQLDKLQEERVRQTKVGSKLLRRDARGIREVFILQQLRPTTRAAVSPLPRAARELHSHAESSRPCRR